MKNVDLNVGGIIGGLAGGGLVAAIAFTTMDIANGGRGPAKFIVGAVIGGAIAGNFLWGLVFKKSK